MHLLIVHWLRNLFLILNLKGMDKGVLIQPSFLGFDNTYMVNAIKKFPDKLYGVAVVDTTITLKELQALDKKQYYWNST